MQGWIPPLAFDGCRSVEFNDSEQMSAELSSGGAVRCMYRPASPAAPFGGRISVIKTGSVRLTAAATTPISVTAEEPAKGILLFPLNGITSTQQGQRSIEWGRGRGAAFLPPVASIARSTARSVVGIDIDLEVVGQILQTMLGDGSALPTLDFSTMRTLNLNVGGVDFRHLFSNYISALDGMKNNSMLLHRSGIDDAIIRASIVFMHPEILNMGHCNDIRLNRAVSRACEYIDARLKSRITMTDLERVSGVSGRSLQYGFRSAYNRTPMQWVTDRRLAAIRSRILSNHEGATLTEIAGEYFSNLGDFARLYKAQYGELPSHTRQRILSRRVVP